MNTNLHDIDYATLGFYEPGFIHLQIATRENLNDFNTLARNPISAHVVSIFFHEYIHFLQDISTTHGLLNFIHAVEYLKNANKQVMDNPHAEFATPVRIQNGFNFATNTALKQIYYGEKSTVLSIEYLRHHVVNIDVPTNGGDVIPVPKYNVHYYDNGAQMEMTCHFGSLHIKEFMAHAMQKRFAPDTTHHDIPYVLVELIIKKEYPRLAADSSLIVALCDATLMHYHPAHLFYYTLKRMKETGWIPNGVDSVYDFVFGEFQFNWKTQTETVDSLYKKTAESAIEHFRDGLRAEIFKNNVQWFSEVITEAMSLRREHCGFFTQLVPSSGKFSPLFSEFINRLGTPFMTNAASKGFFNPPEKLKTLQIHPYFPKVFQAICRTYQGQKECELYSFCATRTDRQVTNDQCLHSPWERVNMTELCPYAQMWKTWGLVGKKPSS